MGAIPLLALYVLFACAIALLPAGARLRRAFLIKNISVASAVMLQLLGVRVHVKHRDRLRAGSGGRLIVSNHVSYIDVLVIASLTPAVFITSVELGGTLFLGVLARLGGSLFVERRKASGLKGEIAAISRVLREGFCVTLFPEGTTSNGDRVQPFKNSLFDSAVITRADIFPVCLRYTRVNGERLTILSRDNVFYYGGVAFLKHFLKLLTLKSVDVEVVPLKSISAQAHHSRKDLAAETHKAMSAAYHG